jgi:ADP-heptose:LPS heptosyltransferase
LATKQWSESNFARLGDRLHQRYGLPVIFSAACSEIKVLQDVQNEAKETHLYWADLPLGDLFALIDGCRLFIGNDSGPTHAASALKKPLVVVWGSSDFAAWRPRGTIYEAIGSDLPCIPCPGYSCDVFEEPKCILEIPVSRVAEACDRILIRSRTNRNSI